MELSEALEKHGATYEGYCAARGADAISEEEYNSEITRIADEYKALFNATPRDEFARLEAWLTLCHGEKHSPAFVARQKPWPERL